jgi:hypothetical protein
MMQRRKNRWLKIKVRIRTRRRKTRRKIRRKTSSGLITTIIDFTLKKPKGNFVCLWAFAFHCETIWKANCQVARKKIVSYLVE